MYLKIILSIIPYKSIWPIDTTLTGTTSPNENSPKIHSNERGDSTLPSGAELEPHHCMQFTIICGVQY